MVKYVLGISCFYHDSAACLIKDGKIIAAAQEERFTRKKHDPRFPKNAVAYCLKEGGIAAKDLAYVAFYEKPLLKFERLISQHIQMFPRSLWSFYKAMPSWINEKLRIPSIVRKELKYDGNVLFIEHHLAHAASAFLVSPFKEAAILTVDGVGEWATATYGYGKENEITLLKEQKFPHSIGLLYSAVTGYLGFKVNNDEYKVMGLAPYGKPNYVDQFKKIVKIHDDGSIELDMSYFVFHYRTKMYNKKFEELLGPSRKPESEVNQRHKDIAKSLQVVLEESYFKMLNHLHKETKMRNLCVAGGVALNSVANGKILDNTKFEDIFIQPAAGDAGGAMGAALYAYNTLLGNKREEILEHAYWGPSFSHEEIKKFLDDNKINYKKYGEKEMVQKTAELIYKNNVVGWFQGRMEWGPRALGARSILSNATNPQMKDILNLKVKHREAFRPFAPVCPLEDAKKFFDIKLHDPFMLFVCQVKKGWGEKLPSITHIDNSARLQTHVREINHRYYDVMKEFEKLSGIPVLINTSFNIRGEPIVCTPYDAYRCMMGTGIDYLVMDTFIIARADNPQDMWDSEHLAKD